MGSSRSGEEKRRTDRPGQPPLGQLRCSSRQLTQPQAAGEWWLAVGMPVAVACPGWGRRPGTVPSPPAHRLAMTAAAAAMRGIGGGAGESTCCKLLPHALCPAIFSRLCRLTALPAICRRTAADTTARSAGAGVVAGQSAARPLGQQSHMCGGLKVESKRDETPYAQPQHGSDCAGGAAGARWRPITASGSMRHWRGGLRPPGHIHAPFVAFVESQPARCALPQAPPKLPSPQPLRRPACTAQRSTTHHRPWRPLQQPPPCGHPRQWGPCAPGPAWQRRGPG